MKVVLLADVKGVGKKGELINAAEATHAIFCCRASLQRKRTHR